MKNGRERIIVTGPAYLYDTCFVLQLSQAKQSESFTSGQNHASPSCILPPLGPKQMDWLPYFAHLPQARFCNNTTVAILLSDMNSGGQEVRELA